MNDLPSSLQASLRGQLWVTAVRPPGLALARGLLAEAAVAGYIELPGSLAVGHRVALATYSSWRGHRGEPIVRLTRSRGGVFLSVELPHHRQIRADALPELERVCRGASGDLADGAISRDGFAQLHIARQDGGLLARMVFDLLLDSLEPSGRPPRVRLPEWLKARNNQEESDQ